MNNARKWDCIGSGGWNNVLTHATSSKQHTYTWQVKARVVGRHIYSYIYIHTERERKRETKGDMSLYNHIWHILPSFVYREGYRDRDIDRDISMILRLIQETEREKQRLIQETFPLHDCRNIIVRNSLAQHSKHNKQSTNNTYIYIYI